MENKNLKYCVYLIDIDPYDYVYKNGYANIYSIYDEDVVYFTSDLWNKHSYIYVCSTKVNGPITSILPSAANATSIVIKGQTYQFSPYFDKNRLTGLNNLISLNNPDLSYPLSYGQNYGTNNIGDTRTIVLDINGKVIDIY